MEVTSGFIAGLRRKLSDELPDDEQAPEVLAAFDRAALASVLPNGEVPSSGTALTKNQIRGRKAAQTRAKRKAAAAKEAVNAGKSGDNESSAAE